jgi:hypothetical protein
MLPAGTLTPIADRPIADQPEVDGAGAALGSLAR